jgi:DNA repair protein RecN (Recombination protein N)
VIVTTLDVTLEDGFTVLTGETGAGKSILIDALQLTLGARADAIWVREGAQRCEIGAEFEISPAASSITAWCIEHGFDMENESLLLRRSIDKSGRSRAWINGSPATATQLRTLGEQLVDIHGQHAWQALTRPASVRTLLDAYGRIDTTALTNAWHTWQAAENKLTQARLAQQRIGEDRQRLLWHISEVEKLNPGVDEWEELNLRHTRLSNAQALIDTAQEAMHMLEGGEDEQGGALALIAEATSALLTHQNIEPQFAEAASVLESCAAQLRDVSHGMHTYLGHTETDPQQVAAIDERISQWISLARRWRIAPDQVPAQLEHWQKELVRLDEQADLDTLEREAQRTKQLYLAQAKQVSAARAKTAPNLSAAVTAAMQKLGMAGGRFESALTALEKPAAFGLESVQFLVAPHTGVTARPLERIASGGELSRLALAIAVTTSALGQSPTLVFDEVDSGIGGTIASIVGKMLLELGCNRQVLCVTHLAQVAACADQHYVVDKRQRNGVVSSTVQQVHDSARISEVARMLGGDASSAVTRAHAVQLLMLAAQTNQAKSTETVG